VKSAGGNPRGKQPPALPRVFSEEEAVTRRAEANKRFTPEELCHESAVSWRDIEPDGSWHARYTYRFGTNRTRRPRDNLAQLAIYRHQNCDMPTTWYKKLYPHLSDRLGQWWRKSKCSRTMEANALGTGGGLGSRYTIMAMGLASAMYARRVYRVALGDFFYTTRSFCESVSEFCYVQPITNCPNVSFEYPMDFPIFDEVEPEPSRQQRIRMTWPNGPGQASNERWGYPKDIDFPAGLFADLDENPKRNSGLQFWWQSQMTYYILQPQEFLMRHIEQTRAILGLTQQPYFAIHVRHGDKSTEGSPILGLEVYVKCLKEKFPDAKRVFLMSDDREVIKRTAEFPEYEWSFLKIDRWDSSNTSMQQILTDQMYAERREFFFGDGNTAINETLNPHQEFVNTMTETFLAAESAGFICTLSSSLARLILRFRLGAFGELMPVWSLDPWRKDARWHFFRDFPSRELSKWVQFYRDPAVCKSAAPPEILEKHPAKTLCNNGLSEQQIIVKVRDLMDTFRERSGTVHLMSKLLHLGTEAVRDALLTLKSRGRVVEAGKSDDGQVVWKRVEITEILTEDVERLTPDELFARPA